MTTNQSEIWSGNFGAEYTARHSFKSDHEFNQLYIERYGRSRDAICADWLAEIPRESRILEVGCNIGLQLSVLQRLGFRHLFGIEIQRHCVELAKERYPTIDIIEGDALDVPFKDGFCDLVFTNNFLIHIAPENLPTAFSELSRVSRGYIWGFEYFSPKLKRIDYRNHTGLLWKADYGRLLLEQCEKLELVREETFDCLDEPGNVDKSYLLKKMG